MQRSLRLLRLLPNSRGNTFHLDCHRSTWVQRRLRFTACWTWRNVPGSISIYGATGDGFAKSFCARFDSDTLAMRSANLPPV